MSKMGGRRDRILCHPLSLLFFVHLNKRMVVLMSFVSFLLGMKVFFFFFFSDR